VRTPDPRWRRQARGGVLPNAMAGTEGLRTPSDDGDHVTLVRAEPGKARVPMCRSPAALLTPCFADGRSDLATDLPDQCSLAASVFGTALPRSADEQS
jgi:hypothetical protein